MADKKAEDLFISDGEYKAPALRGAFEQWADRDWSIGSTMESTIKVREDHTVWVNAFRDFEAWLNNRVDDDWYKEVKSEYGYDEPKEIFHDYWESNREFRESIEEHVEMADKEPDRTDSGSGDSSGDGSVDSGDSTAEDQSSFGESQYPQLYELGVVDDDGTMHRSKLRGLVVAFAKDVDCIKGSDPVFDSIWAKRAFIYWAHDKWGKEWIDMMNKYLGTDYIYDAVEYVYVTKDDVADILESKYSGNQDMQPGNKDTDDLMEAFLDSEDPGWREEDSTEDNQPDNDKWEEYEQQSRQENGNDEGTEEGTDKESEKSKWDKYEAESKEDSNGESHQGRGDGDEDVHGSGGSDNSNGDSDSDGPGTLGEWAQQEGSTDDVSRSGSSKQGQRSLTNGQSGSSEHAVRGTGGKDEMAVSSSSGGDADNASPDDNRGHVGVECEDFGRPHEIKLPEVEREEELERNRIYEGNTFQWAMRLPKNSVDTMVTSPPYYALRDYDIEDAYPISGDFTCDHDWQDEFCTKCGAFLGQLGHEPDPATFVEHIVDLMDRYREVLKPSGSLWLNIGDTYAGKDIDGRVKAGRKSRMMIPERIYRRMVQTGWHLRDYVIWVKKVWMPDDDLKGNGKPFAGSSRLADQWEPMVRFTPQPDHYSDVDSNRLMPPSFSGDLGSKGIEGKFRKGEDTQRGKTYNELGTNPPDVWLINSDGYDGDHRAVFPEQLPKRCINISTPDRVCNVCGRPFDKETHVEDGNVLSPGGDYATYERRCRHDEGHRPGIAFDPFLGSGTTAVAAANSGFDWAGVELSEKYAKIARERIPTGRQVGLGQY